MTKEMQLLPLPRRSRRSGYDTHGHAVDLGDTDADGYTVGYISPDGLASSSHQEAECNTFASLFEDAFNDFRAGRTREAPDPWAMARRLVHPENVDAAVKAARDQLLFWAKLKRLAGLVGFQTECTMAMPNVDPDAPFDG
jgi:hypothetical protein